MSRKNKKQKFSENRENRNVLEEGKPIYDSVQGHWNDFFQNENDLVVELACGRGEYTIALAEQFPEKNYIGVDIKGERIWKASQTAMQKELTNVAFLRTHINNIDELFSEGEVAEIWLTFPDPRPKERDEKHRLSNSFFLSMYKRILMKEGWFKFKTDNTSLFDYTLQILSEFNVKDHVYTHDLYHSELLADHFDIKTKYEQIWTEKGETIKYMKFRFG